MSEFNKFKITEKDLPEKARKVISKMCRDRKWQMSIPPNEEDSDMVLVRVIDGFTNLKEENEKLKKIIEENDLETHLIDWEKSAKETPGE